MLDSRERLTEAAPFWWADGHLDLAYLAVNGRDLRAPLAPNSPDALSLPALSAADVRVALGTIFTECGGDPAKDAAAYRSSDELDEAHRAGVRQLEWYEAMERDGALRLVRTVSDLEQCTQADGPLGVVLLMECADPIRSPDEVAWWHARGLRVVGLSWGHGSRYAGGNARAGGLTAIGRRMVEALDACGILHDASHLSRQAFDDLLTQSSQRVIASHSNAQALLDPNERHITDAQIAALRDRDGWIGLNLYGRFLASGRRATIDDCVAHVEHVASIAGADRVGLGSDLDGGFGRDALPLEVQSPTDYARILARLHERGFAERARDHAAWQANFAHRNLIRVLRAVLPSA
jgi:membrane dipeptidase